MPFKKDCLKDRPAYLDRFLKELKRLKAGDPGELCEFWFYDGAKLGGVEGPVLVFGEVMPDVLKTLKTAASARAAGSCFYEDGTLKLSLVKGKMPEKAIKPLFVGIPFTGKLVGADLAADGKGDASTDDLVPIVNRLKAQIGRYNPIKGALQPAQIKIVTDLVGEVKAAMDGKDYATASEKLDKLERSIDGLIETAGQGMGADMSKISEAREKLAKVFDALKGKVSDESRKTLHGMFGAIDDAIASPDANAAKKAIFDLKEKLNESQRDIAPAPDADREKFDARVRAISQRFAEVAPGLTKEQRAEVKKFAAAIKDAIKAGDLPKAAKAVADATKLLDTLAPADLSEDEDTKAQKAAEKRQAAAVARFDKVKGRLSDEDRLNLRKGFQKVADEITAAKYGDARKSIKQVDVALLNLTKALVGDAELAEQQAEHDLTTSATLEEQELGAEMRSLSNNVAARFTDVQRDRATAERFRLELGAPDIGDFEAMSISVMLEDILDDLEDHKKDLADAKKELKEKVAELKAAQLEKHPALVKTLKSARDRIVALDEVLESVPFDVAREAISATVEQMSDATQWREDQLSGAGHGTSRHGAQTGFERQARRAATAESVTPEQGDNKGGSAQVLDWNKVKITYTEEDGKRVVKNRRIVAQEIVGTATAGGPNTEVGSMWATPVLEKLAYDSALKFANKMKDYTHYQKSNGSWGEFKKYTVFLSPPDGQPGWGYAVEHDPSDAYVTKEEAEEILKDFENGRISLDQMFRNFNTKLAGTDGAADLIKYATVCFKRGAGGDPWDLLTMYPNGNLGASGWEAQQNWNPGSLVFCKGLGGAQDTYQNNTLP